LFKNTGCGVDVLNRVPFGQWLRDRSGKPGDDLGGGIVPDL